MAEAASEYERQRLLNIAANEALLKQLDLGEATTGIRKGGSAAATKKKRDTAEKRSKPKPKAPREPAPATRSSSRIAGIELVKVDPAEAAKRQREVHLGPDHP
jgi:hypothetical protein